MTDRTERLSTRRPSIQISLVPLTATRMLALSLRSAVEASGRFTSMPASLTKDAVTMKKISMMKTTSNIGVRSISDEVSPADDALEKPFLRMGLAHSIGCQVIFEQLLFAIGDSGQIGRGGHLGSVCHDLSEHLDHPGHRAQQPQQGTECHQGGDQRHVRVDPPLGLADHAPANLLCIP